MKLSLLEKSNQFFTLEWHFYFVYLSMDNKVDYFQRKLYNTRSFTRQRKKSRIRILIFVILLILWWWFLCRKFFFAPVNLDDVEQGSNFSLWEEIYLQWEINANGDDITHSHKILDPIYWEIFIKSDSINLFNYNWFVELTWIVEKFYQGTPIVKVSSISWSVADDIKQEQLDNIVLDNNAGYYMSKAGIQFLPGFFDEYLLRNDGENGQILIENIETWEQIAMDYFRMRCFL